MKLFVAILFTILASIQAEVLQYGDSEWASKISTHETALVMFFAPWCGHCKRLKPEFDKAATTLAENDPPVALIKVDCTEDGKDTCSKFGVSGYPTLKIFRDGDMSSDYNGPREANGIVKFMTAQVGPVSKELSSLKDAINFLAKEEVAVILFDEGSSLKDAFMKVANKMRETVRFAHSVSSDIGKMYGYEDKVVLFRPPMLKNKFEPTTVVYGDDGKMEEFIKSNYHGLVGHRTPDNAKDFESPLVVAYFNVDYNKNPKGTNYWRNRVMKVAKDFKSDFTFAIASKDEFQQELNEFGLDYVTGDKPVVCVRDDKDQKFVLKEDFSMDSFKVFLNDLKAGKLETYTKSEPEPESQGPVKVAVGKNFEELVTNSGRDALIEFYAPWCGHCKKLAPIYDDLGEQMKNEKVDIVKMDATANDAPAMFTVKGFPTIYWKPKSGSPVQYNGGRELNDFIEFIAKESSEELSGWDRQGKEKKEKEEL